LEAGDVRQRLVGSALVFAAVALAGLSIESLVAPAYAGQVTFKTVAASDSDGPISDLLTITTDSGGLDITIMNTDSGTLAKGQAVSDFSFTVGGGLGTPTAFTELKGLFFDPVANMSWTPASGTPFDDKLASPPPQPYAIDHWGFQTTGSSVLLATAGSPVPGAGNPTWMILPATGTAGPGKSLANSNFFPFVIGPTDFFLSDPGVTASTTLTSANFTDVKVSFGTGPDAIVDAFSVPEPSSVGLGAVGLGFVAVVGFYRSRRRRQ
jgi:hypothetical protein